ncbi:MAG: hypothetical protein KatS3mg010_1741 [Acidimicrobiia bacterium]|nr:MAG: hypothetical protein KatS3mg010_1741 [Acidimicrobiia bacterium]
MVHRRRLVGREGGGRRVRGGVGHQRALVEPHTVHEHGAVGERDAVRAWPAVAPGRAAVGQHDVAVAPGRGAEPLRLERGTPHEPPAAGVVVVGTGEEVQPLAGELERGCERVRRPRLGLGCAQLVDLHGELDDDGAAGGPVCVQLVRDRARLAQCHVVDADARVARPVRWEVGAGLDDQAAAEQPHGLGVAHR